MNHKNKLDNIFKDLTRMGFLDIKSNDHEVSFLKSHYTISFLYQRWEGWECYLYLDKKKYNTDNYIPINNRVFNFTNKHDKINANNLSITEVFEKEGGFLDILRLNKIMDYFNWYNLNYKV